MNRLEILKEYGGAECVKDMTEDSHEIWFPSDGEREIPKGGRWWDGESWLHASACGTGLVHRWPKESKFKVGSVWFDREYKDFPPVIFMVNDVDERAIKFSVLWYTPGGISYDGGFIDNGTNTAHIVPFYAPSQSQLDAKGKEIDCIREVKQGDDWMAPDGLIVCDCVSPNVISVKFNGLRYILKDKKPIIICRAGNSMGKSMATDLIPSNNDVIRQHLGDIDSSLESIRNLLV